ncbi:hypothetical protein HY357_04475 [Candidatus Roizmanbacteria bacterium]|nr:hypothetical protein [Candidatus Roizmanbacteria bacterium]
MHRLTQNFNPYYDHIASSISMLIAPKDKPQTVLEMNEILDELFDLYYVDMEPASEFNAEKIKLPVIRFDQLLYTIDHTHRLRFNAVDLEEIERLGIRLGDDEFSQEEETAIRCFVMLYPTRDAASEAYRLLFKETAEHQLSFEEREKIFLCRSDLFRG